MMLKNGNDGKKAIYISAAFVLVLASVAVFAQDQDRKGSEDHQLISRYPGSVITYYDVKEFDEYILPVAPLEDKELTDTLKLEGKVTQIQYKVDDRSTLEVFRNYESALKQAGFEILFEEQGNTFSDAAAWVKAFYDKHSGHNWASFSSPSFAGNDFRYLAGKLSHPEGDIYVSLYITSRSSTTIQLDVIESAPMEEGLVTVDADYLRRELERTGFVAIYGIYFETDSAEMTEDSRPALDEIAKLLEENPEYHFYVVGHTDNTGSYDHNLSLSQKRAESVAEELMKNYNISEDRLIPVGVGPVSPVAVNTNDEGRARNRRMELVVR